MREKEKKKTQERRNPEEEKKDAQEKSEKEEEKRNDKDGKKIIKTETRRKKIAENGIKETNKGT